MNGICMAGLATLVCAFTPTFSAVIEVSDTIGVDAVWESDTVRVIGEVVVADSVTLTVAAGTRVEFDGFYKLIVNGAIRAVGNETDSIYFSASNPEIPWHGIRFYSRNGRIDSSHFAYCRISHTHGTGGAEQDNNLGGALYVKGFDSVSVTRCVLMHNRAQQGGGMYLSNASIRCTHTVFDSNTAFFDGGGIHCDGGSLSLDSCRFVDNSALNGGAVFSDNNQLAIHGGLFENNAAQREGGAIKAYQLSLSHSMIIGNSVETGTGYGGGVYCWHSGDCTNNLIAGNRAIKGGGLYAAIRETDVITNNTIVYNHATSQGGGVFLYASSPTITNTLLWGNTVGFSLMSRSVRQLHLHDATYTWSDPDIYHCNIQGGAENFSGNGAGFNYTGDYENNIDSLPHFADSATGDYSLLPESPCVNRGTPDTNGFGLGSIDLSGAPRIVGDTVDIGAFEVQDEYTPIRSPLALKGRLPRMYARFVSAGSIAVFPVSTTSFAPVHLALYNNQGSLIGHSQGARRGGQGTLIFHLGRTARPSAGRYVVKLYSPGRTISRSIVLIRR